MNKNILFWVLTAFNLLSTSITYADSILPFGRYKTLNVYFSPYNEEYLSEKDFIEKSSTTINSTEIAYVMAYYNFISGYKFKTDIDSSTELKLNIKVLIQFYDPVEDKSLVLVSDGKVLFSSEHGLISDVPDGFLNLFTLSGSELIEVVSN